MFSFLKIRGPYRWGKLKKISGKKRLNLKKETLLSLEDDLELSKSEKFSLVLHFKLVFLISPVYLSPLSLCHSRPNLFFTLLLGAFSTL